jgi:NADH-quinone oxidoreductase subunit L
MSVTIPSYYLWLIFILPYAGALLTPLLARNQRLRDYAAVSFSFLSAIFALQLLLPVLQGQSITITGFTSFPWISALRIDMGVLSDPYTIILSNVVAWVSFLIMMYSLDYMKSDTGLTRYWFFMNLFIGNMQLIVLSDNLLALFIGWEGVGLCSYALIGHYYRDEIQNWVGTPSSKVLGEEQAYSPSHAGMKAFVMTRVGDVAMLAGIIIVFIYAGTFSFQDLAKSSDWAKKLAESGLLVPVALLIFGGAIGKSAQFPLHEWLPDAMAGPASVSALIHAATMVKAGVVLVARIGPIFYFVLSSNPALIRPFFETVAWIGAFTAFLAATHALVGFEMKKIMAYSTISQIGYMMMALGLTGLSTHFAQGLSAGLYHLTSHAIFKASLFMTAGALIHITGSKYINEMGGLRDRMKITFAVFLIATASLSGIPPFSGFWSKDAVLATAWDANQFGLFAVGAITAGLTAFYSFRMLGLVFFGKKSMRLEEFEKSGAHIHEVNSLSWIPYAILGIGTVIIGVLSPLFNFEGALESISNGYLATLFPIGLEKGEAAAFNVTSASIALLFAMIGVGISWLLYVHGRTLGIVGSTRFMHGIYSFLENRWYINALYYKTFVNIPLYIARHTSSAELRILNVVNDAGVKFGLYLSGTGNWIDNNIIDGIANGFSSRGQSLSRVVRKVQTGVLEQYILIFSIGLLVLLLIFILTTGVYASR